MADPSWADSVDALRSYVFRISTPQGSGTGFLISRHQENKLCAIATAAHVVEHAHYWEGPIRFEHAATKKVVLVRENARAIFLDAKRDTAAVLFAVGELDLPVEPLPLAMEGHHYRVGNHIGWVGFPAVASTQLCFFGGEVSAWVNEDDAYLIDGVAINGVSGGPAFARGEEPPRIIGVVSAYIPNRVTGETLPGLAIVRDVSQFHELAPMFANFDQAKAEETPPASQPPPVTHEADAST